MQLLFQLDLICNTGLMNIQEHYLSRSWRPSTMAASLNNTDIRNLSSDRKNVLLSEGQMECLRMKNSFYAVFMSIDF